jgi:hypothetical protein
VGDIQTDDGGLQVDHQRSGHHVAVFHFVEERAVAVVRDDFLLVFETAVRLDAVLETVQFPRCVADLHTGLADMDRDTFPLSGGG